MGARAGKGEIFQPQASMPRQAALCRVALTDAFLPGLQAGRLPPEIKGDKHGIMEPLCCGELQLFSCLLLLWSGAPVSELQQSHWNQESVPSTVPWQSGWGCFAPATALTTNADHDDAGTQPYGRHYGDVPWWSSLKSFIKSHHENTLECLAEFWAGHRTVLSILFSFFPPQWSFKESAAQSKQQMEMNELELSKIYKFTFHM